MNDIKDKMGQSILDVSTKPDEKHVIWALGFKVHRFVSFNMDIANPEDVMGITGDMVNRIYGLNVDGYNEIHKPQFKGVFYPVFSSKDFYNYATTKKGEIQLSKASIGSTTSIIDIPIKSFNINGIGYSPSSIDEVLLMIEDEFRGHFDVKKTTPKEIFLLQLGYSKEKIAEMMKDHKSAERGELEEVPSYVLSIIERHCRKKYPFDPEMRDYTRKQQISGYKSLLREIPDGMSASDFDIIKFYCRKDWPTDFQMRAYEEKQQVEGYFKLIGLLKKVQDPDKLMIKPRDRFPDDFSMQLHLVKKNLPKIKNI